MLLLFPNAKCDAMRERDKVRELLSESNTIQILSFQHKDLHSFVSEALAAVKRVVA